jgi:hypothetical protein
VAHRLGGPALRVLRQAERVQVLQPTARIRQ